MIERINLIEKKPFEFTYQKLLLIGSSVILLATIMVGVQFLRAKYHERSLDKIKTDITRLEGERERLLKAAPPKVNSGRHSELLTILSNTPKWGQLMLDVSNRLPSTVWLTQFEGVARVVANLPKNDKKNRNKKSSKTESTAVSTRELLLNGVSRDFNDLAMFLNLIEESPFVKTAVLSSSSKDKAGFTFEIRCDMMQPGQ